MWLTNKLKPISTQQYIFADKHFVLDFNKVKIMLFKKKILLCILTENPELEMNIMSLSDSTVVLEVEFNVYPSIANLKCNSLWVPTTIVVNGDNSIDVRGMLTLK